MKVPIESSFEKLLVLLVRSDIRFTTVGGIAVCLNGYVRLTEDVGILVDSSQENVLNLLQTLGTFGEGFASELSIADFTDEEGAIRIIEAAENCQIDIFVKMRGLYLSDFEDDIQFFEASENTLIPYLGSKSLITLKSETVREKDKVDVSVLQRLLDDAEE